ncbi:MAG: hypothetical protein QG635_2280 [Bacteroidota bacterium]|nr:hypothetical protein [Bacteroidota bacterium]
MMPKILYIVEDDDNLIYVISKYLKNEGYETVNFTTGTSFVKYIIEKNPSPDLLILDNMLPDYTSKRIIETIQEKGYYYPFIIMTGKGSEKTAVELFKLGAKDYIIKDISFIDHLLAAVTRYFKEHEFEQKLKNSKKELEDTQQRINNFFENSIDAIFVSSIDGKFLEFNNSFLSLFDYSKEELLSFTEDALYQNISDRNDYLKLLKQQNYVKDYPVTLKKRNGDIFQALIRATTLKGDDGSVVGFQGVIRDLSEQIESEHALLQSEERWKFALEGSGDGLWDYDIVNNKIYRSQRWKEILGYSDEEIVDNIDLLFDLVHPDDLDYMKKEMGENLIGESSVFQNEFRLRCKDGSYKWILDRGKIIEWDGNKPKRIIGTHSDITDRKKFENQLKESEEKFRGIVQNSTDGIVLTDENGLIILWNKGIERITGFLEYEVLNHPVSEIIFQSILEHDKTNEFEDSIKKLVADISKTGYSFDKNKLSEYTICCKDKSIKDVQQVMFSIPTNNGFKLCAILRDITELKSAQEEIKKINIDLERRVELRTSELRNTLEDLENEIVNRKEIEEQLKKAKDEISMALEREKELNILKSRFISMISHEYRTPLTIISTSVYILEKMYHGDETGKFDTQLKKIKSSIVALTKLLENVLNAGTAETTKIITDKKKFDLLELINMIVADVKENDKHNHEINIISSKEFIEVSSDEKIMKQILSNLISNSVKFSPNFSSVNIIVKESMLEYSIMIADEGIGILPEEKDKVFDTFFRGTNIGVVPGTGLGLSIVKRCVDALKGQIFLDSEPNKGSKFNVILPK